MQAVAPEEEAYMLYDFVNELPNQIEKPLDAWQAMTALLALNRYEQREKTSLMDFLFLDDAYKVLKVSRPDLADK